MIYLRNTHRNLVEYSSKFNRSCITLCERNIYAEISNGLKMLLSLHQVTGATVHVLMMMRVLTVRCRWGFLHFEIEIETYETFRFYDMKPGKKYEYKVLQNLGKHKCDIGSTKHDYRSASKFFDDQNTIF